MGIKRTTPTNPGTFSLKTKPKVQTRKARKHLQIVHPGSESTRVTGCPK